MVMEMNDSEAHIQYRFGFFFSGTQGLSKDKSGFKKGFQTIDHVFYYL
jgi:hypothetical protein